MNYDDERRSDTERRVGRCERYLESLAELFVLPNPKPRDLRVPSQTFLDSLNPSTELDPVEM